MATLMVLHVALGAEGLAAAGHGALEGPLVSVNPHVDPQVLLLGEGFVAAGVFALVRLRAIVHVHVGVQSHAAAKNFHAPFEWARVDAVVAVGVVEVLLVATQVIPGNRLLSEESLGECGLLLA